MLLQLNFLAILTAAQITQQEYREGYFKSLRGNEEQLIIGSEEIPSYLVKYLILSLKYYITYAIYPLKQWKLTRIAPVLKKDDSSLLINCRSVM